MCHSTHWCLHIHLIFMLIMETRGKRGKDINPQASYDCIKQEMIDESGNK